MAFRVARQLTQVFLTLLLLNAGSMKTVRRQLDISDSVDNVERTKRDLRAKIWKCDQETHSCTRSTEVSASVYDETLPTPDSVQSNSTNTPVEITRRINPAITTKMTYVSREDCIKSCSGKLGFEVTISTGAAIGMAMGAVAVLVIVIIVIVLVGKFC